MNLRRSVFIFLFLISGCDLYPTKTLDNKLKTIEKITTLNDCNGLENIFIENQANPNSKQKSQYCEVPISKKYDFICAYSDFLSEDNDWELEGEVFEKHLLKYKDVTNEKYYSMDLNRNEPSGSPTIVAALGKWANSWLILEEVRPYEDMPVILETQINKEKKEHSFLGTTCIDTRTLSGELSIRIRIPI